MKYDTLTIPLKIKFNFYVNDILNTDNISGEIREVSETDTVLLHFACKGVHLPIGLGTKVIFDVKFIARLDIKMLFNAKTLGMQQHITYHDLYELYNISNIKIQYDETPHKINVSERAQLEEEIWKYLQEHGKEPLITYYVEL